MKYLKYIFILLPFLTSCSDSEQELLQEKGYIRVSAGARNMQFASRATAAPFEGENPTPENPLESALWFSTINGVYFDKEDLTSPELPVHTGIIFDSSQMEYVYYNGENIQYPTDNTPVYCIGLSPNDEKWELSADGKKVTHPINGSYDLMFARPIIGTWNEHFGSKEDSSTEPEDGPLQYEHALTWVKIAVCAVSADALKAWGKLESLKIYSSKSVEIDLSTDVLLVPGVPTEENMEDRYEYYKDPDGTHTDGVPPIGQGQWIETLNLVDGKPLDLTQTMDQVGSVFVSPAIKYYLKITTENNEVTTPVELIWMDLDNNDELSEVKIAKRARGKCFVLSLYFHPYNVVTASCTLERWNIENDNIYLKEDK